MRLTSGARLFISGLVLIICGFVLCPGVSAQNAPSLQEQIKAQYKLVKIGFGPTGITVTSPAPCLASRRADCSVCLRKRWLLAQQSFKTAIQGSHGHVPGDDEADVALDAGRRQGVSPENRRQSR